MVSFTDDSVIMIWHQISLKKSLHVGEWKHTLSYFLRCRETLALPLSRWLSEEIGETSSAASLAFLLNAAASAPTRKNKRETNLHALGSSLSVSAKRHKRQGRYSLWHHALCQSRRLPRSQHTVTTCRFTLAFTPKKPCTLHSVQLHTCLRLLLFLWNKIR